MKKKPKFEPFPWSQVRPAPVIGVDEVGRGCLAGRVYAAAVILCVDEGHSELTDSKLLSETRREELAEQIRDRHQYGIGYASVEEVDRINILQASLLAMKRAVEQLGEKYGVATGHLLVDGTFKVPRLENFEQTTLVKGDLRAAPVAAASILAKVTRDHYMQSLAADYPAYGFARHKGYSTAEHKSAIAEHGPCAQHRKTFKGVREYLSQ